MFKVKVQVDSSPAVIMEIDAETRREAVHEAIKRTRKEQPKANEISAEPA